MQLNTLSRNNKFIIDVNRKGNKLPKFTLQLRESSHKDFTLLRLDILGPDHPNPIGDFPYSGEVIPCPHLHIAHPEFGSSIAYPLNTEIAELYISEDEMKDIISILRLFLRRCNIGNINEYRYIIQNELF